MATLSIPQFIERDPDKIVSEIKADFETRLNKPLNPGQPEMQIVNSMAYRELLLRSQIQSACEQMLVDLSSGLVLDHLAVLVGVERLAATSAKDTLLFVLEDGHTGVDIPAGTQVQSTDGKVIFVTTVEKTVDTDVLEIEIEAECTTSGTIGNGYLAGDINVLLDPLPFIVSVSNTGTTGAGSDVESDDEFKERIRLAPNSYSVAGPELAYKFWAKTASALIIDVAVVNITAGQVNIYPLVADGSETSSEVIDAVQAILSDETIRPLGDGVVVASPTRIEYELEIELEIFPDTVEGDVIDKVTEDLTAYAVSKRQTLGRDIIEDQIKGICMIKDQVYKATIVGFTDIIVDATEFAYCTGISVTVSGTNEG